MLTQHPLKEILYRIREPKLVVSLIYRHIVQVYDLASPTEFSRQYRKVKNLTMCSGLRLRGLYKAINYIIKHNIPGDVVECGTARGGSAALMALTLKQLGSNNRTLWVFDTFAGLPPPTKADPDYEIAELYTGSCVASIEDVSTSFECLNIHEITKLIKGPFQDTLGTNKIEKIALLHIDCDWYESVKTCLENLYDCVTPGGVIQIDDYGFWKGARKAVDEFFESRSISPGFKRLDYSGRQFIKPE